VPINVDIEDLTAAFEWVSGDGASGIDAQAWVCRDTGKIIWIGDGIDEEVPDDLENEQRYLPVPDKRSFDMGRPLVFRFIAEHLPGAQNEVSDMFRHKGAYSRLRQLLDKKGLWNQWNAYQDAAIERELRQWCEDNGFMPVP